MSKRDWVVDFYPTLRNETELTFWHVLWAVIVVGFIGVILLALTVCLLWLTIIVIKAAPVFGVLLTIFVIGVLGVSAFTWMGGKE
jgi:hypothetical protein